MADELPEQLKGHGGPIEAISISADGKSALTASFDYSIIYWDISKPEARIIHRMIGHDNAVNDVVFSPDGLHAVSVSDDGSLGIWNLETGKLTGRIKSSDHKVLDVAISADGKYAAAARWDATARIYDLGTQSETMILRGHRGNVNSVAFSADGKFLYSAAYDGQIIEWNAKTGEMIRPVYRHGWGINTIALSGEDRVVFGALDGTFGVVDITKAELIKVLAESARPVQAVKTSANGKLMGYGDGAGIIEVFNADNLEKTEGDQVTFGPVWDFDFVSGGSQIFHVGLDDFAARWQVAPHKLTRIKSKYPRRFQLAKSDVPGELEFRRKCSVCHTLTPDGANRAGPTLHGLFGRHAGTLPGYEYSAALKKSTIIWNEQSLGRLFDDGPDVVIPGTKMPIQRLKNIERRDDLINYLKSATATQE